MDEVNVWPSTSPQTKMGDDIKLNAGRVMSEGWVNGSTVVVLLFSRLLLEYEVLKLLDDDNTAE